LDAVETRLAGHAAGPVPAGLTEPDPDTGERWSAGQVWGHVAEILPYWMGQVRLVLAEGASDPVPFGRSRSDPGRLEGIERGRHEPPTRLLDGVREAIAELSALLSSIDEPGWAACGRHQTLGVMDAERIVDEFMVGHLEGHARQLDLLREGDAGPP